MTPPDPRVRADKESFELANKAFDLLRLDERERCLRTFASLRYPSIVDRFVEAVHQAVIEAEARTASRPEPDRK